MKKRRLYQRWYEDDTIYKQKKRERHLRGLPQFSFNQIYFMPFTHKRVFEENGSVHYEPIDRNITPTGVKIFDQYLQYLDRGNTSPIPFYEKNGLISTDIDSLTYVLTGMNGIDFRLAWQMRMAEDLLRYTNMELKDVAQRSGIGSATNLYYSFHRDHGYPPGTYRLEARESGDLGRFIL